MRSSHNSSTTRMATAATKKTRRLLNKVMFTSRGLQKLDLDVMEAFVVKQVEVVESHAVCYPER